MFVHHQTLSSGINSIKDLLHLDLSVKSVSLTSTCWQGLNLAEKEG